jgi:hypothetical protein
VCGILCGVKEETCGKLGEEEERRGEAMLED